MTVRPIRQTFRHAALIATACAVLTAVAHAQNSRPAPAADLPQVSFERHTLPNGLQVILHVDRKLPIVHVNQWFHVGSKNERIGRTGFAHLFEHMMFQGSKHAPGEYFSLVERAGANLREGGVNGTTSQDRTNYFATVPSGNLEQLLWIESDRLATLLDVTTQEKLDNQRDVVKNERRQGLENQPYGRWYPLMMEAIFPAGHPYSWPVIGSQEDLSAASLEDVKEFFRQYYTPNNLSLVIAGDFEPAEAKRLVEKYFGDLPPGPALDRPARWVPALDTEKLIEVSDRVSLERVYIGWPGPEYFSADDAPLGLGARILSDGLSSRLNRALVYDRQLATAVSATSYPSEIAGFFFVMATARPGTPLPDIERVVTEEIARLAKEGPTPAELDRAKAKYESEFVSGLERIGGFGGKADILNQYNVFLGDPGRLHADVTRHRTVTPEQVRNAVARWIDTPNRAIVRFRPEGSVRPDNALTLDRSVIPPLGADRPFTAPAVQTARLENGMDVFVVERTDLPKVHVTLASRAGAAADPGGKAGVAHLTATTMRMGTPTRTALEVEEAFGALGTTLGGGAGREAAQLSLDVLSRHVGPALALLGEVVQSPVFPEAEVTREQKRLLDMLAQQERSPNGLANRLAPMLAFGGSHPYGTPTIGLPATVEGITRDDLVAFHRAQWRPGSSAIVFAGDITLQQATALAREHFGRWSGGAAPALQVRSGQSDAAGRIYIVDRPGAAQTVVVQWLPAPARTTPDYVPLGLVDAVWGGGGFGTRLNLNLREDKGYSYGVFSNLALFSQAGTWSAAGGVQTDKTKEALVEFDRELKNLAGEKPISEEELANARERRLRGYAQQFESLGRVGGQIVALWAHGLPMTELQQEYDQTAAVTTGQVLEAARRYVKPGASFTLLVGDRARIEKDVRELNLGEVVVIDALGKPVAAPGRGTRD